MPSRPLDRVRSSCGWARERKPGSRRRRICTIGPAPYPEAALADAKAHGAGGSTRSSTRNRPHVRGPRPTSIAGLRLSRCGARGFALLVTGRPSLTKPQFPDWAGGVPTAQAAACGVAFEIGHGGDVLATDVERRAPVPFGIVVAVSGPFPHAAVEIGDALGARRVAGPAVLRSARRVCLRRDRPMPRVNAGSVKIGSGSSGKERRAP